MTKLNTVVLLLMMILLRLSRRLKLPGAQENSARTMVTDLIKRKSRDREGLGKPKGAMLPKYELLRHQLSGLPSSRPFLVLGIETSCDDTGVAVVSSNGSVLANVVYSQYEIHERFGGVVPSLAMESHKANVDKAIAKALETAGLQSLNDIDAVAVTRGPGLEICLRVGCRRAQSIALEYRKPFVTVHHLEAHCLIARLAGVEVSNESSETRPVVLDPIDSGVKEFQPKVEFPFLVFLASGGHTSLMLCHGLGDFRQLGGTLDDALGEAFDKAARLLGLKLSGSGGAAVEALARSGNPDTYRSFLRVPMRDRIDCDFSYAGMKSSFRLAVVAARAAAGITDESKLRSSNAPANQMEESPEPVELPSEAAADLCAAFQDVAFQHVEDRLHRALDYVEDNGVPVTALVVVGGSGRQLGAEAAAASAASLQTDRRGCPSAASGVPSGEPLHRQRRDGRLGRGGEAPGGHLRQRGGPGGAGEVAAGHRDESYLSEKTHKEGAGGGGQGSRWSNSPLEGLHFSK